MLFIWNAADVASVPTVLTEISLFSPTIQSQCNDSFDFGWGTRNHGLAWAFELLSAASCLYFDDVFCAHLYELGCPPAVSRKDKELANTKTHRHGKAESRVLFLALLQWLAVWSSPSYSGGKALLLLQPPSSFLCQAQSYSFIPIFCLLPIPLR